jgi:pilus assembly protein Flp/PilA
MRLCTTPRPKWQGLVEYALILVLIAIAVILVVTMLGGQIDQVFANIIMQMENPGTYSGPAVSVSSVGASASRSCVGANCSVIAGAAVTLSPSTLDPVCVQFRVSGGGSRLVCGTNPSFNFSNVPASGSVTACVIGVENHSLSGGGACQTVSYP